MTLRWETAGALARVHERATPYPLRDAEGRIPVAPELMRLLVAMAEDIARLERRIEYLEARQ